MALTLNKNSQITVGGSAVGRITGWNYDETDTQIDTTTFDSTGRDFANLDLVERNVSISAQFDLADTGQDTIRAGLGASSAVAIVIYPNGNTSGQPSLTGTILVGSRSVNADGVDGVIMTAFAGKLSALTEGTVS